MTVAVLPLVVDQTIYQYATWRVRYRWTVDGVGKDFTGWTAKLQVRQRPGAAAVILQLATGGSGITLGPDGLIELVATDEQTAALTGGGAYDLCLYAPDGSVTRFLEGALHLDPGVTRP